MVIRGISNNYKVNHTPSFQTDSNLDYVIKKNLILDTFILLNLKKKDKKL